MNDQASEGARLDGGIMKGCFFPFWESMRGGAASTVCDGGMPASAAFGPPVRACNPVALDRQRVCVRHGEVLFRVLVSQGLYLSRELLYMSLL